MKCKKEIKSCHLFLLRNSIKKKNSLKKVDGVVGPETYKALTPNAIPPPAQDVTEDEDIAMLDNLFSKD